MIVAYVRKENVISSTQHVHPAVEANIAAAQMVVRVNYLVFRNYLMRYSR